MKAQKACSACSLTATQKPTSIAAHNLDETENTMFEPSFRAQGIMAVVSGGSIRALWSRMALINEFGAIEAVRRRTTQVNKFGAQLHKWRNCSTPALQPLKNKLHGP